MELSPQWSGQRRPFRLFQRAITRLAHAYDIRDGKNEPRIRISVDDINGKPITATYSLPVAAFDDLLLAVQELADRSSEENRAAGWCHEDWADADISRMDKRAAAGKDLDEMQAKARDNYAAAARLATQPHDIPT